jgi:hypothetical protein
MTVLPTLSLSASSHADVTSGLNLISKWAAADFDGDMQPEIATLRPGSSTPDGHWHHVSIALSSGRPSTFSVASREALLHLFPRDVDEDGDTDLVLVRPLANEPIGVWLNEGSGQFHEGRIEEHRVGTFRIGGPSITQSTRGHPPSGHWAPTRSWAALSQAVTGIAVPPVVEPVLSCWQEAHFSSYSPASASRAPPLGARQV